MSSDAEKKQELAQALITNILLYKNPYDVFDADGNTPLDEIHKKYKKISLQIHPDKCKLPQAVDAFDILKKAMKILEEEQYEPQRKKYLAVMEQAKKKMEIMWKEKSKVVKTPEDEKAFRKECKKLTQKMLVEIKQETTRADEIRLANERREKELKQREAEKLKAELELEEVWELDRDNRVGQWRHFQTKVNPKKRKKPEDELPVAATGSPPASSTSSGSVASSSSAPVPSAVPPTTPSTAHPAAPPTASATFVKAQTTPVPSSTPTTKPVSAQSSSSAPKVSKTGPAPKSILEDKKKKYIPKPLKPPKIKLS